MIQPANTVAMVDVSAGQGPVIAWDAVYASGILAVYIEHGVGNDQASTTAAAQVAGARAAGLLVGRYDFLYPIALPGAGRTPQQQAALHSAIAADTVFDLVPVIDLEWPDVAQFARWGCSPTQIVEWVLEYVEARGVAPMIYTMPAYMEALGHPAAFGKWPLWLAEWTEGEAEVPKPWSAWTAWQFSSSGHVPGIQGPCDQSWLRVVNATPTDPELPPISGDVDHSPI
jgi:lysozyme